MLYLHIPFCEKRCGYCSFNTFANKQNLIPKYIDALIVQLDSKLGGSRQSFKSVYFGGGTPSLLSIKDFEKIFKKIAPYIDKDSEVTIEANPSSWSKEKAKALISMGANRVSLGMQSLEDEKLIFLSRVHDKKAALKAYDISIQAGFENISIDLMYDTKFDNKTFLKREIDAFLALSPTHISAYSLTIEENTPFEKKGIKSRYDGSAARFIAQSFIAAGYEHYEVANFGRIRSQHNFGYWEYRPYIGVGAGAVGFDGKRRFYSHTKIEEYIKNPIFANVEELSYDNIRAEKIFLGLRSAVGVDKSLFEDKSDTVQIMIKNSLLCESKDRVHCMDFFLADEIATRLI